MPNSPSVRSLGENGGGDCDIKCVPVTSLHYIYPPSSSSRSSHSRNPSNESGTGWNGTIDGTIYGYGGSSFYPS